MSDDYPMTPERASELLDNAFECVRETAQHTPDGDVTRDSDPDAFYACWLLIGAREAVVRGGNINPLYILV